MQVQVNRKRHFPASNGEGRLTLLACSNPPPCHAKCSLGPFCAQLVELDVVECIPRATVTQTQDAIAGLGQDMGSADCECGLRLRHGWSARRQQRGSWCRGRTGLRGRGVEAASERIPQRLRETDQLVVSVRGRSHQTEVTVFVVSMMSGCEQLQTGNVLAKPPKSSFSCYKIIQVVISCNF